jgi:hypothetical protein
LTTSTVPIQEPAALPSTPKKRGKFRIIPKFEDNPRIVSFSQTVVGKLLLLAIFGLALSTMDDGWMVKLAFLSAMAFLPRARWLLVLACTLLLTNFFWFENVLGRIAAAESVQFTHLKLAILILLPFVLVCAALMLLAARWPKGLFARRPLPWLLAIYGVLLLSASYAPLHGFSRFAVWAFLVIFSGYFWFLAYAVTDCAARGRSDLPQQFATFHAFWGGSPTVPVPKGASHWRRIEAKTPEELAITMIKGVKLIVWCCILSYVSHYYGFVVYQKFKIPTMEQCLGAFTTGKPFSLAMNWLSLPGDFLENLLLLAVGGHLMIAICRMAGFRALRATYAPLSSRTVAEYWNRFYYYFKELLVDMFFYPTFIRYFKHSPKLRIFFATFVAASVGNLLFHFMRDIHKVVNLGLPRTIVGYDTYVFYSLILALGISVSQVRSRKPHASRGWLHQRLAAPAVVFGFYCLVHVFDSTALGGLANRLRFFVFLFSGR